jgi:hypothetical protein
MNRAILVAAAVLALVATNASAADHKMTGAELTTLLGHGKTVMMGGPGLGMTGQLVVNADGTASGSGKVDSGQTFNISGTWLIKANQFCRTWQGGRDSGKQVCETWVLTAPNVARVMVKNKQIGQNSWS